MGRRPAGDRPIPLEAEILLAGLRRLRTRDSEFHGYGIARDLYAAGTTKNILGPGTFYKALRRMESKGWLQSRLEDAEIAAAEGRPRRRLYTVTDRGAHAVAEVAVVPPARARGTLTPVVPAVTGGPQVTVRRRRGS